MTLSPRAVPGSPRRAANTPMNSRDTPSMNWEDRAIRALKDARDHVAQYRVSRPSPIASLTPVIGPAWEAAADLQDGNYGSAAFNGAMAVADAFPIGAAFKLGRTMKLLNQAKRSKDFLPNANQMSALYKRAGLKGPGEELHHTIPLNEWPKLFPKLARTTKGNIRNHPALLKVMDEATHKLAHKGTLPQQIWHRSNALQKSVVTGGVAKGADMSEARASSPSRLVKPTR